MRKHFKIRLLALGLLFGLLGTSDSAENGHGDMTPTGHRSEVSGKDALRSIQVELPGQEHNPITASWPGIGTWFWTATEFTPEGYKPFVDLYAEHTSIRLLMTSIRHPVWVDDPAVHDQIKAAAAYARANDMAMVMDLDVRLARQAFRDQYPDELQDIARLREVALKDAGTVSLSIEGITLGDHYTFCAPPYASVSGRLLRVYSYVEDPPAVVASSEHDATTRAGNANDGIVDDTFNFWASADKQDVGAWWQVDLGRTMPVSDVQIRFRGFDGRYHFVPRTITFQLSDDGETWTTVLSKSADVPANNSAYSDEMHGYDLGAEGRYVRLVFEDGTDDEVIGIKVVELVEVRIPGAEIRGIPGLPFAIDDITDRCEVEQADGGVVRVSISCSADDAGRRACVMAAFTLFTPDVFAPHLPAFEKSVLKQYADVQLAGACKDEWGFPGRFNPLLSDLWYSEAMAQAYATRRPGRDLAGDLFLMFKGEDGQQKERAAAINHYMRMFWEQNAKLEQDYYDSVKDVFGPDAVVATHPTWYPHPSENEIFKNGLDWWAVRRDLAQTDETTPYCVRTALAKTCHSPLWYNMYYHSEAASYESELWRSVLGGGRIDYHQLFPYPDWQTRGQEWLRALLRGSLMQAECRIQLLNLISTQPVDCPVAVIFGHAAAINWTEPDFADVGLGIADRLWESGVYTDLIPSSEIAGGALRIAADGSIQYGAQRYSAAVLYNPEYEPRATADFFAEAAAGGKTALFRVGSWSKDFEGGALDGAAALPASMAAMDAARVPDEVRSLLEARGIAPYTNVDHLSGRIRLLDGTVIVASGRHDVMGDPIQETVSVQGHDVTFDSIGIAAVRLDENGRLEAMAAGGLASFQGGDVDITMPSRADVALWKDRNGAWQGVLQGYQGELPTALTALCRNWTRLRLPARVE